MNEKSENMEEHNLLVESGEIKRIKNYIK